MAKAFSVDEQRLVNDPRPVPSGNALTQISETHSAGVLCSDPLKYPVLWQYHPDPWDRLVLDGSASATSSQLARAVGSLG